jgi:hypothetical protein
MSGEFKWFLLSCSQFYLSTCLRPSRLRALFKRSVDGCLFQAFSNSFVCFVVLVTFLYDLVLFGCDLMSFLCLWGSLGNLVPGGQVQKGLTNLCSLHVLWLPLGHPLGIIL